MHSIVFPGELGFFTDKLLSSMASLADISSLKVCKAVLACGSTLTINARQGLFAAPTRIIVAVAPINVLLNYLLGVF
jgi:hypothetical protein